MSIISSSESESVPPNLGRIPSKIASGFTADQFKGWITYNLFNARILHPEIPVRMLETLCICL